MDERKQTVFYLCRVFVNSFPPLIVAVYRWDMHSLPPFIWLWRSLHVMGLGNILTQLLVMDVAWGSINVTKTQVQYRLNTNCLSNFNVKLPVTYMQTLNAGYVKIVNLHMNTYKHIYAIDIHVSFALFVIWIYKICLCLKYFPSELYFSNKFSSWTKCICYVEELILILQCTLQERKCFLQCGQNREGFIVFHLFWFIFNHTTKKGIII